MKYALSVLLIALGCAFALSALRFFSTDGGEIADMRGEKEVRVVLTHDGYEPRLFRIEKGTRVVFSTTREHPHWPASNEHPSHMLFPEFDPKEPVPKDKSWEFVFERPGEWRFHDHIRSYYTGVIYVEE